MATVSEVAVEYNARGARATQRADRNVRSSIQETAKTARNERGTIDRWMERHQTALRSIAAATAGVLGSILAASPRARAELSGIRTAFSLLADTIVRDVLPGTGSASEAAFDLVQAYRDLPDPVRETTSALIAAGGAAGAAFFLFGPLGAAVAGVGSLALITASNLGILDNLIRSVINTGKFFISLANGDWSDAWDNLTAATLEYSAASIVSVTAARTAVIGSFATIAVRGVQLSKEFVDGVLAEYTRLSIRGPQLTADLTEGVLDRLNNSLGPITGHNIGLRFTSGLADGIRSGAGDVSDAARGVAGTIRDKLPGSDAEEGPLDDFTDIPDTMTSEIARVGENTAAVDRGARQLAAAARPPTGGGGGGGGSSVEITIERGAIQLPMGGGAGRDSIDERELADSIFEEAQNRSGGQTGPL